MPVRSLIAAALVAAALLPAFANAREACAEDQVQLVTLDPGHFHAALVQKFDLPGVDRHVRVYAPAGEDVEQHLERIQGFNEREGNQTWWDESVYTGPDYLEQALIPAGSSCMCVIPETCSKIDIFAPPPTVVVISGNNARKSEYITRSIGAGFNVLADKPMVIVPAAMN